MPRHLRVQFPGAIYHVTCRMVGDRRLGGSLLFVDNSDRQRFVERLGERVEQYNIRLYMFTCMTNHFHLVIETPEGNLSKFMQSILTAYTVYYNLRHERHGHLLDGRYKAKLVEGDDYLLALTRYVHLNPVKAGPITEKPLAARIKCLRSYRWSTYQSYIGECPPMDFVDYGPVLAMMRGVKAGRPRRYRQYVERGLAADDDDFLAAMQASPRSIGSDSFRARADDLYDKLVEGREVKEDVAFRHTSAPLPVDRILAVLCDGLGVAADDFLCKGRSSALRAIAAQMLVRFGGLTQRQVAEQICIGTGAAVSMQLRRLPGLLEENPPLGRKVALIERKLLAMRKPPPSLNYSLKG